MDKQIINWGTTGALKHASHAPQLVAAPIHVYNLTSAVGCMKTLPTFPIIIALHQLPLNSQI